MGRILPSAWWRGDGNAAGRVAGAVVGLALVVSGCTSGPDADAAVATAREFLAGADSADTTAMCDLLAPATAEALETNEGGPCAEVIAEDPVGPVLRAASARVLARAAHGVARVAGRQAQVRLGGEVVFLVVSGDRWLVSAAGCTARPGRPYDCVVEGS